MSSANVTGIYYIQSQLNNFVLDLQDNGTKVGTGLVVAPLNPDANKDSSSQLWAFGGDGTITNVATEFVVDIRGGVEGTDLIVYSKKKDKSPSNQTWTWHDPYICCEPANKVIDVEGMKNEPGAKVIAHPKNGGVNQQWRLIPRSTSSQRFFHGDPDRENNFWVYPHHRTLVTARWDTYNPYLLCNNFTALNISESDDVHEYRCQGHEEQHAGQQEYVQSLQNHTAVSLKSLGHMQGSHWLNSSYTGVNLLASNASSSTLWYVHVHSIDPLVISLRCHDLTGTNRQWLTRTNDNEITLGDSENDEGARWNVTFIGRHSICVLSNAMTNGRTMFLDGYTANGAVGLATAPYNSPDHYTGAYWKVITRK